MQLENNDKEESKSTSKKKISRRLARWILLFCLLLIVLCVGLTILINSPKFQRWAVQKTTAYLSEELNTTVAVEEVSFDIFNHFILRGLYVEDLKGDTLVTVGTLKTDFTKNLFTLFGKSLNLEDVILEDVHLRLHKDTLATKNNLGILLSGPDTINTAKENKAPNQKSRPFYLSAKSLLLKNIVFEEINEATGNHLTIKVEDGKVVIKELDLTAKTYQFEEFYLHRPFITLEENNRGLPDSILFPEEYTETPIETPTETHVPADSAQDIIWTPVRFFSDKVTLKDGAFQLKSYRKSPRRTLPLDKLDLDHIHAVDILFDVDSFSSSDLDFAGVINALSFRDYNSGFVCKKLAAKDAHVTPKGVQLNDMELITPDSYLKDTLLFEYDDYPAFYDFENLVYMTGKFKNSIVALKDIMVFAPPLEETPFFIKNKHRTIQLNGKIYGTVNDLKGRNLSVRVDDGTVFRGKFGVKDAANKGNELFDLRFDNLRTTIPKLRAILPNFNPPSNFDNMGNIDFSGTFYGYLKEFTLYGDLKSDLGFADMDMKTEVGQTGTIQYNGGLRLNQFDVGAFSEDKNFGKISVNTTIVGGEGVTAATANAKLKGTVSDFQYRGYTYRNIVLDGKLAKNEFDGKLNIKDENINLSFNGIVKNLDSVPKFDLTTTITKLDLQALNLSKQDYALSGTFDINLEDNDISNIRGDAKVKNFKLIHEGEIYTVDSIAVVSRIDGNNNKYVRLTSGIASAELSGDFDLKNIHQQFASYFSHHFPKVYQQFNLPFYRDSLLLSDYEFEFDIHNTKNFTHLISPDLDTISDVQVSGFVNNYTKTLEWKARIPKVQFGKVNLGLTHINLTGQGDRLDFNDSKIERITINNGTKIYQINTDAELHSDTLHFQIEGTNFEHIIDLLNIRGIATFAEDKVDITLDSSDMAILNEKWTIHANNSLSIGNNRIQTNDFQLSSEGKSVTLETFDQKGLQARIQGFDFDIINEFWDYDKLNFYGDFAIDFSAEDIFKMRNLEAKLTANALKVNTDDWGRVGASITADSLNQPVNVYLSITDDEVAEPRQIVIEGTFQPGVAGVPENLKNTLDLNASLIHYPLRYLEYFIGDIISGTKGTMDASLHFAGPLNKIKTSGGIDIYNPEITINYLQTQYTTDVLRLQVDTAGVNVLPGYNVIYDQAGNPATLEGGLAHNYLRNFGPSVTITAPELICLNTKKGDNSLFYGYAVGDVRAQFSGTFAQTDLKINGRSLSGTKITIPFGGEKEASDLSFVRFKKHDEENALDSIANPFFLRGMHIDMNLDVNENAEVAIIFDEQEGDILKGVGVGNLRFEVTREKDFYMDGNYQVSRGEYLFSLYNLANLVKKPFEIKQGGTILWTGDPYNAQINIDAEYKGLRTSLYSFLLDYLESASTTAKEAARNTTSVDLTMHLKGALLSPDITFDILFPELRGELKSYTDSKLSELNRNPNELNRQVFGLIVLGTFLPPQSQAASNTRTIISNTVSEFLSSQLSFYLTELLSEVFTDINFNSDVDLDVAYNVVEDIDFNNPNALGTEYKVSLENRLVKDKLVLRLGGNVLDSSDQEGKTHFGYDVALEVVLTPDSRYKIRFYSRSEPELVGGIQYKHGVGLIYRREFNSFDEFFGYLGKVR